MSLLVSHPEEVSSLTDEQSIRLRSHTDVVGIQKELILLWSRESVQHESLSIHMDTYQHLIIHNIFVNISDDN